MPSTWLKGNQYPNRLHPHRRLKPPWLCQPVRIWHPLMFRNPRMTVRLIWTLILIFPLMSPSLCPDHPLLRQCLRA